MRYGVYIPIFGDFFFNDPPPTQTYTLSLHDALPISRVAAGRGRARHAPGASARTVAAWRSDRKSTRLNSSHVEISYAVFCLKKKKKTELSSSHKKKKKKQE